MNIGIVKQTNQHVIGKATRNKPGDFTAERLQYNKQLQSEKSVTQITQTYGQTYKLI